MTLELDEEYVRSHIIHPLYAVFIGKGTIMLRIRDAAVSDLPAIMEIYNEAIRNSTVTFDTEEKTLEERMGWFRQFGDRYPLIVAELDSQVVGYCGLMSFREKDAYSSTTELSIYINKNYRGNKIGSLLMKEIIERAIRLGYHTIISGISDGNEASFKLHEKFGFQRVGCLREVGYKFNHWRDVYFYQRMLSKKEF